MTRNDWREAYRDARTFGRTFTGWAALVCNRWDGLAWRGGRLLCRYTEAHYSHAHGLTYRRVTR